MTLRVALETLPVWLAGQLLVYHADGSGSFTAPQSVPVCQQPGRVVPTDLDNDGRLDLIALCPGSDLTALQNMGTAEDTTPPLVRRPPDGFALQADTSAGATLPATDAIDDREGYIPASCSPAVVPPGTWDVTCTAVDASGNSVSDVFPVTVAVVRIDFAPPAEVSSQTANFDWQTLFATRTSCSLDGGAYALCSAPRSYKGLAAGVHSFCVVALDDVVPQCASWTIVGPGAPAAWVTGVSPVPGKPRSRTITFAADQDGVRFACSLDGAAFKSCSSGLTYNGLALGSHTIRVQATNFAGQVSVTPASAAFTVG